MIDGQLPLVGINLADDYINRRERAWGNWMIRGVILQGDAAWSFTVMFLRMRVRFSGKPEQKTSAQCMAAGSI
ncbi:MAG: hypothetical protein ACLTSZ_03695 [Lachnospiraceae bacterium]